MNAADNGVGQLLEMYKLHADLAEQAASLRESLNKLYSGMVASIVGASVLLHRFAPDASAAWVLPILGMVVSLSWMVSLNSATGRLAAKHVVLQELEAQLPFPFFKKENEEFDKLCVVRRRWSGQFMPITFLLFCLAWLVVRVV